MTVDEPKRYFLQDYYIIQKSLIRFFQKKLKYQCLGIK